MENSFAHSKGRDIMAECPLGSLLRGRKLFLKKSRDLKICSINLRGVKIFTIAELKECEISSE